MRMTKRFAMLCTAALAVGLALPAQAQDNYPSKPITMLVGFAAGGGTDILARKAAEELQKELGQPVVVVNRPGGGSIIAWKELVATEADGYTITMFLPVNGFIQKYLDSSESWIDPLTDIRMLGIINEDPWGIAAGADAPYDDAKAFTEWTQSNPGARVSDGGPATAYHWGWQAFASETGADIRAITYRGATAEGLKAAASGEVAAAAAGAPEAASLMEAGHVKMLAIAADERLAAYPHLLRHTVATKLLVLGMDITDVQRFLGHENITTTRLYAETTAALLRRKFDQITAPAAHALALNIQQRQGDDAALLAAALLVEGRAKRLSNADA